MTAAHPLRCIEEVSRAFSGKVGVWARHLGTGETLAFCPRESFETASAIKTLIMVAVLRLVTAGHGCLDEPVVFDRRHLVLGSGILRDLTPGLTLSLRDALLLMIVVSDNIATNMLIERAGGVAAVNAEAERLGLRHTRLLARLDFASGDNAQGFGRSTPEDLGGLYAALHAGACVAPAADAAMRDILARQQFNTLLTRDLPYHLVAPPHVPGQEPPLRLASKSGAWDGARCDAGNLCGPRCAYVLAVMSDGCADRRFHLDNEAMVALPAISRAVWEYWGAGPAAAADETPGQAVASPVAGTAPASAPPDGAGRSGDHGSRDQP